MAIQTKSEIGAVGTGAARGIAFGGGGEWFVTWMLGYALGLKDKGVDLSKADVSVGTSAGSIVGTVVMSDHLWRMPHELELLGKHPALANRLLSLDHGAPSQIRATSLVAATTNTDPESIKELGRAAMAARNADAEHYEESLHRMLGHKEWPEGHFTTAVDCYTGEPLIVSKNDNIPIAKACAASSSVPGVSGPVWLDDRYCMDGGVSTSSTHADLLSGAKVILVMGMFDFETNPPKTSPGAFGMSERIHPGTAHREAELLRAHGSTVHVAIANPDPSTNFMDAALVLAGMEEGRKRGADDSAVFGAMWNESK